MTTTETAALKIARARTLAQQLTQAAREAREAAQIEAHEKFLIAIAQPSKSALTMQAITAKSTARHAEEAYEAAKSAYIALDAATPIVEKTQR